MSFFKKIKDKLFKINNSENDELKHDEELKTIKTKSEEVISLESSKEVNKIAKIQEKINKKEEKKRKQILAKTNKINKYVSGLSKSGNNFSKKIIELQNKHNKIDDD